MKVLDFAFVPKCPRCGDDKGVNRINDTLTLICMPCKLKFRILEEENTSLWQDIK